MGPAHQLQCPCNRLQFKLQAGVAPGVKLGHPGIGQGPPGVGFDQSGLAAHGAAQKKAHALMQAQRPTGFVEHGAQHAVGDGFAIDQHAVAIEQQGVKFQGRHKVVERFKSGAV